MSRLLSAALAVALFGGCATTSTSGKPAASSDTSHVGATAYASTYAPIASAPVLITDAGRVVYANRRCSALLGVRLGTQRLQQVQPVRGHTPDA